MNKTITYGNKQPCPQCKDTDRPCVHCGRVRAEGKVAITTNTTELKDLLLKVLDWKKES